MSAHAWAFTPGHSRRSGREALSGLPTLLAVLRDVCAVLALSYRLRTASRP